MTSVTAALDRFAEISRPGPFEYRHHHHHDGGSHGLHLVIGAIIHGNEVGSLPSVLSLIESLNDGTVTYGGRLTVVLGNPEAALAGRRFLDVDLNRVFFDEAPAGHESERAKAIMPILDDADVFFDIHQTILASDRPFFIFPFSRTGWHWARAVAGASTWVTRPPGQTFSTGTVNTDEYVRLQGKPGFTLELGAIGFSQQADGVAGPALSRLVAAADAVGSGQATVAELAEGQPDLEFVETAWTQRFDDPTMRLRPGLRNFMPVSEGETLSALGAPEVVAPIDGVLLFPKYPDYDDSGTVIEPRPGELVRIVQPMTQHPVEMWPDA